MEILGALAVAIVVAGLTATISGLAFEAVMFALARALGTGDKAKAINAKSFRALRISTKIGLDAGWFKRSALTRLARR